MKKPNFQALIKSAGVAVKKHSPEILTGIGIAGMITTTVLAVRATPKALQLIEQRKDELEVNKLSPVETVKTAWKPYIPAVVTGVASTACLIGASRISLKRNAMLATAYKLSETAMAEYRDKVVETIGEKKEQEVRDKIAEDKVRQNPPSQNTVIVTGKEPSTCFDPISSRWFKCNIDTIKRAEVELNRKLQQGIESSISVNEFYDELDLPHTDTGDAFGWNAMYLLDLDISYTGDDDGNPAIYVGHYNAPKYDYM